MTIKILSNTDAANMSLANAVSVHKTVYLLNFPKIALHNPPMAPAILQSIAKEMGATVNFADVNLLFQQYLNDNTEHQKTLMYEWPELSKPLTDETDAVVTAFCQTLELETIFNSDIVGISVFSANSIAFTDWFLTKFKGKFKGKIVVGGAGAGYEGYGKKLVERQLVDYCVTGEGELSWRAILSNNLPYPGVNSAEVALSDFSHVPLPDYDNYELDEYMNSKAQGTTIGVEGSRGCVRDCTFCDIKSFWKKYKFKDGNKLAEELIALKEKFKVNHFFFNDSLVNGSDKAFRNFIRTLAAYNKTLDYEDRIKWSGYYIIKPMIVYKDQDWQDLKDSGVRSLFIGIESGSERVRDHMRKKFSNADLDYTMKNIQLYGIRCTWLLIVGYATETEEDFQETLDLLTRYRPMGLDKTIDTVALGSTLGILQGSPLYHMQEELGIQGGTNSEVDWVLDGLDFKTRVLRRIRAEEVIRELGYNSWTGDSDIINYFEEHLDTLS